MSEMNVCGCVGECKGHNDVEPTMGTGTASRLPKATTETDLCDVCKQPLGFPADDDPAFVGDTAVTSKCRHTVRMRDAESAPQTFEDWLGRDYPDIARRSNNSFRSMAKGMEAAWNAAKSSSPVVAGGESATHGVCALCDEGIFRNGVNSSWRHNDSGSVYCEGLRAQPLIKDVRGK